MSDRTPTREEGFYREQANAVAALLSGIEGREAREQAARALLDDVDAQHIAAGAEPPAWVARLREG